MKRAAMHLSISLLLTLGVVSLVHGYSAATHSRFSYLAFSKSLQTLPPPLMEIPLFEARALVLDGSEKEDLDLAHIPPQILNVLAHFVDPQQGNSQLLGVPGVPNSPDWALEDNGDRTIFGQANNYSYKHARDYYFDGLTALDPATRQDKQRLMFKTLGHVIHHIQDSGQPQHVRDDSHCSLVVPCGTFEIATGLDIHEPSEYEQYSDGFLTDLQIATLYNQSIYGPAIDGHRGFFAASLLSPTGIHTPRDFWLAADGMATFTSNNFLSVDTNYVDSVSGPLTSIFQIDPDPKSPHFQPNASTAVPLFQRSFPGPQVTGNMYFFKNSISDGFNGQTYEVNQFSTFSVFDDELVNNGFDPLFVLNRYTFEASYPVLVPRIVAFSAGLLDYFFRGRISVHVVDSLNYQLVNNSPEAMLNGTVHLVIQDPQGKRSKELTWSNVNIAPNGGFYPVTINYNQVAASLDPPLSGISSAFFVYDGSLGQETRAIAVSLAPVIYPPGGGGCGLTPPINVDGHLDGVCVPPPGGGPPFYTRYRITWGDLCPSATAGYRIFFSQNGNPYQEIYPYNYIQDQDEYVSIPPAAPPTSIKIRACSNPASCPLQSASDYLALPRC